MARDIDLIMQRLRADVPGIEIWQLKVKHPGDDDGLWFINLSGNSHQVQLESSSGECPFLVESDFNNDRFTAQTIDEAIAVVKQLYSLA